MFGAFFKKKTVIKNSLGELGRFFILNKLIVNCQIPSSIGPLKVHIVWGKLVILLKVIKSTYLHSEANADGDHKSKQGLCWHVPSTSWKHIQFYKWILGHWIYTNITCPKLHNGSDCGRRDKLSTTSLSVFPLVPTSNTSDWNWLTIHTLICN